LLQPQEDYKQTGTEFIGQVPRAFNYQKDAFAIPKKERKKKKCTLPYLKSLLRNEPPTRRIKP
jgi:hypothetical protein